jgi:hypothetical protein
MIVCNAIVLTTYQNTFLHMEISNCSCLLRTWKYLNRRIDISHSSSPELLKVMPGMTDEEKIVYISDQLISLNMSPKEFIAGFLTKPNPVLRYRHRTWATKYGWTSTIELVKKIRDQFLKTEAASDRWTEFIQEEV